MGTSTDTAIVYNGTDLKGLGRETGKIGLIVETQVKICSPHISSHLRLLGPVSALHRPDSST